MRLPAHGAGARERVEGQLGSCLTVCVRMTFPPVWSVLACFYSLHWHAEGSAALSVLPSSLQIVIGLLRASELLGS